MNVDDLMLVYSYYKDLRGYWRIGGALWIGDRDCNYTLATLLGMPEHKIGEAGVERN